MRRRLLQCVAALSLLVVCGTVYPRAQAQNLTALLDTVANRVREYFDHAQSIVATEVVNIQPFNSDLLPSRAFHRRLEYELRVAWDAAAEGSDPTEANVMRRLIKADGRDAKPGDEPRCLDPPAVSPEPLTMLLREHRSEYEFKISGQGRVDGRQATMIDFKSVKSSPPEVQWKEDCVSWSSGTTRGRVWVDATTGDVLRLDHYLARMLDLPVPRDRERRGYTSMTVERADQSIRYKEVAFQDPEETLMLPASIEILVMSRGSAASAVRTFQTFSNYKRFLGDSHLVTEPQ